MHQELIRFSMRIADGTPLATRHKRPACSAVYQQPTPAREDNRAATLEGRACTQNKVLVIMDYGIFRKQAYRGTGSQRDSISEVTRRVVKPRPLWWGYKTR